MCKIPLMLILFSAILISCSPVRMLFSGESGNVESIPATDEEMNAAIQQAQDTLPLFIGAFQAPTPTQTRFSIKVRFPFGDDDEAEHMWVSDLSFSGNQFNGILGNEPIYVNNLHLGDRVTVDLHDISDW